MAFLEKEELKTVADINLVDKITNLDDDIVTQIIEESIDLMKGYLSRYYDADAIFLQEGELRKKSIVKKLKDIVIYAIYSRLKTGNNPQTEQAYSEAMSWLEKINTGEQGDGTLPTKPKEEPITGETGDTRFGGNKRYSSAY